MGSNRKIASATLVMGGATFLSRIAGLLRDMIVARLYGAGLVTDAFFMAFTLPNLLRRFFAEGSLTAAFVPIFSNVFHQRGEGEAQKLANRCATLLVLVMLVVVLLGIFCSPLIVRGIAYGWAEAEAGKLLLTEQLTMLMFPFIGLVSFLALVTGILNVRGHFLLPALSPFFLNLAMILSALFLGALFDQPIFALAVGVLLGGSVQLLLQYPALLRYKIRFRLDFQFFSDQNLYRIVALMLPGIAGVAIYQINIVLSRLLASFLPEGSVSYLFYAQRLFEFPQGIFVVSLAQAALPMMSRQVADDDQDGLRESISFALRLVTLVCLPASIGLILCAEPVYSLFFLSGEFGYQAMEKTTWALICYAPGLILVGYSRIAVQTFYALKDTRTPVMVSFWTLVVNGVAGVVLMQYYDHLGLALAVTIASLVNTLMLFAALRVKLNFSLRGSIWVPLLKTAVASLCMVAPVWYILGFADWALPGIKFGKLVCLLAAIFAGGASFLLACQLLGMEDLRSAWRILKQRRSTH